MESTQPPSYPTFLWWVVWGTIGIGLIASSLFLPEVNAMDGVGGLRNLPLLPLLVSVGLRWVLLPRMDQAPKAFTVFIIGLAMAEASGLIGMILGQGLRTTWFQLAVLGIAQYAPFFAGRFETR